LLDAQTVDLPYLTSIFPQYPEYQNESIGVQTKRVSYHGDALPQGLGTRHAAAAAITQATNSLAFAISESTGRVTIFRGGKILTVIEKAPPLPTTKVVPKP